ncbi:centromere protein K-like isoform X2 [Ptychodera flava]|uniref:centromere protein K-like isoform X2 n=1 Tax=Ptychodera flava TaxID=63121 RepID=UPI00396AA2C7
MVHHDVVNNLPIETDNGTNPMVRVFQAKESRIQGEIDVFKQTPLNTLPLDVDVLKAVLTDELQTSLKQLQETLSNVEAQKQELQADLKKAQEQLYQHTEVQEAIKSKLQEETTASSTVKMMRKKQKKLEKYLSDLDEKVSDFLSEHFPSPTADDARQSMGRRSSSGQRTMDEFMHGKKMTSLQGLIQRLMKAQLERPHDPYIPVQVKYWPPYIELLLRSGVILHKPDDSNFIRLTPFHL